MKVLIIEDDKEIVKLLKISLKKEIFITDYSDDGNKGLFLFRTNHYDLLIIDYNLPSKNGQEIIREIRKENKNIKIIVITIDVSPETRDRFFALEIDDYITKPFAFEELLSRIKSVMRRPNKTQSSVYKIDDLVVDIDKHIVSRDKRNIYLTFKEIMMLEFFLKNKGRVISRTILMENIWDLNADPFSNTVESHILKLRKKLNPDKNKKELIHTIKGRGYKFDLKKW
ncbi:MAG: response regulator transcription factor [Patescibacteria group bacterium]|nr:response regulator transcription factor [Patescibacteria group bacterium]